MKQLEGQLRKGRITEVPEGEDVSSLLYQMAVAMEEHGGIGLAANQLGLDRRIILINCSGFTQEFINPVILRRWGGRARGPEKCLSFPGKQVDVLRYKRIKIRGYNLNWGEITHNLSGINARVAQHEMDHLEGVTMLDVAL